MSAFFMRLPLRAEPGWGARYQGVALCSSGFLAYYLQISRYMGILYPAEYERHNPTTSE